MNKEVVRLTKRFTFEMAHALFNYDGDCRFIHGHSYKLFVTVSGFVNNTPLFPKDGMVCDFSILKKVVNEKIVEPFDHALVLNEKGDNKRYLTLEDERVILFPVQPTCENLLLHFKNVLLDALPEYLTLASVKLYETESSYAEWDLRDQDI